MSDYPDPSPVTDLTAVWCHPDGDDTTPGITLSWTAPTIASGDGTIGGYNVYILLANDSTEGIEDVLFTTVGPTVKKIPFTNSYQLIDPSTTLFFPFSWPAPTNYEYPSFANDIETGISTELTEYLQIADAYSFHVEVFLLEDDTKISTRTGVTVFAPNDSVAPMPIAQHLDPRFNINYSSNYNTLNQYSPPGSVKTFVQDTYEEIVSCVEMILNTPTYSRTVVPDFGIADPTFTTNVDTNAIKLAVARWEPRANVDVSVVTSGTDIDNGQSQLNVKILSIEKTKI